MGQENQDDLLQVFFRRTSERERETKRCEHCEEDDVVATVAIVLPKAVWNAYRASVLWACGACATDFADLVYAVPVDII